MVTSLRQAVPTRHALVYCQHEGDSLLTEPCGGCHPPHIHDVRAGWLATPPPVESDRGSRVLVMELARQCGRNALQRYGCRIGALGAAMPPSTPLLSHQAMQVRATWTHGRREQMPGEPVDRRAGIESCHGAAREGRTGEEPQSGEAVVTLQGCKGELAHPGALDASPEPP